MLFFTLLGESFRFAMHALRTNRLRTMLSLLGVTIGIFSIIAVFSFVDSIESKVKGSVQSLGDDVIFVQKWPWSFDPEQPWWRYMLRPVPQFDELEEVQRRTTMASASAFVVHTRKTIYRESSMVENAQVLAASHSWQDVKTFEIENGRYFAEMESATGRPVVILGAVIAQALFPSTDPLGQNVKVFGRKLQVIGVFKKEGESMFGNSLDGQVVIPVRFARTVMDVNSEMLDPFIMVKAKPGVTNADLIDELAGVMRSVRKLKPEAEDNFALNETSMISSQTEVMFDSLGTFGLFIGIFSLLVGGFGIANIMFVSVRERTGQIGIQKSLGAKGWFILMQFLSESVVLCMLGGVIGVFLVWIGSLILFYTIEVDLALSLSNIVLALTMSTLIGIISGFIPSYSASQLDPVDAIRTNI